MSAMARAALALALLALLLAPSHAGAQGGGLVTMSVEPTTARLVAGEARSVVVSILNGAPNGTYVEVPTVEGLPNGITLAALEGPGGSRPEGTPPGTWLLAPGETKEFTLIFNTNRGVVRTNTTVVLHARTSADQPALAAPLQVVVLSVYGSTDRAPLYAGVPPAAWAAVAGLLLAGGLALAVRTDAGRVLLARRSAAPAHEQTERVLELVRAAPGIGFDELRRASGLDEGQLRAAVEHLEGKRLLRVRREGLRRLHLPR